MRRRLSDDEDGIGRVEEGLEDMRWEKEIDGDVVVLMYWEFGPERIWVPERNA